MGKVKIVTNAVCDLTPAKAAALDVEMIPEAMIFDGISYLTNVDITPQQFYEKMRKSRALPTASHPNVSMYMDAFRTADTDEYDEVLCLNLTSKLSGSINTAFLAKSTLEEQGFPKPIFIYDTLQLTHGLAFQVLEAARLSAAGQNAEGIIRHLDAIREHIAIYFVMKSLENARRGGRLGLIRTVAADALGVRPVLQFRQGIHSEECLVRKFKNALKTLAEIYGSRAKKGCDVVIFHANNQAEANLLRGMVLETDPAARVQVAFLGSGIGIHTGEGAVGITFWEP